MKILGYQSGFLNFLKCTNLNPANFHEQGETHAGKICCAEVEFIVL